MLTDRVIGWDIKQGINKPKIRRLTTKSAIKTKVCLSIQLMVVVTTFRMILHIISCANRLVKWFHNKLLIYILIKEDLHLQIHNRTKKKKILN